MSKGKPFAVTATKVGGRWAVSAPGIEFATVNSERQADQLIEGIKRVYDAGRYDKVSELRRALDFD